MTAHRGLKRMVRERQKKTGESYTAARVHVMRDRASLVGTQSEVVIQQPVRAEAVVLKVNQQSARVRILDEDSQLTFRSTDVWRVVPGHLVTLAVERRWTWGGDAYASGKIENARIDVAKIGLEPLTLEGGDLVDVADYSEPCEPAEAHARWTRFTAKPRPGFEFDGIAWGELPGLEEDENPTCDAAELAEIGDIEGSRQLLMETLGADLRCLDAHAHLGNLVFDRWPERAMVHYEMGIRIGELSLPVEFDGLLPWNRIYNRPFLRCLHGYALCLWRLGKAAEAQQVCKRILALNPDDNQGVRFCWDEVHSGRSWKEMQESEVAARCRRRDRVTSGEG